MISCREEELGMGTVLEFCREYQYVPADFEQKETFGERTTNSPRRRWSGR